MPAKRNKCHACDMLVSSLYGKCQGCGKYICGTHIDSRRIEDGKTLCMVCGKDYVVKVEVSKEIDNDFYERKEK